MFPKTIICQKTSQDIKIIDLSNDTSDEEDCKRSAGNGVKHLEPSCLVEGKGRRISETRAFVSTCSYTPKHAKGKMKQDDHIIDLCHDNSEDENISHHSSRLTGEKRQSLGKGATSKLNTTEKTSHSTVRKSATPEELETDQGKRKQSLGKGTTSTLDSTNKTSSLTVRKTATPEELETDQGKRRQNLGKRAISKLGTTKNSSSSKVRKTATPEKSETDQGKRKQCLGKGATKLVTTKKTRFSKFRTSASHEKVKNDKDRRKQSLGKGATSALGTTKKTSSSKVCTSVILGKLDKEERLAHIDSFDAESKMQSNPKEVPCKYNELKANVVLLPRRRSVAPRKTNLPSRTCATSKTPGESFVHPNTAGNIKASVSEYVKPRKDITVEITGNDPRKACTPVRQADSQLRNVNAPVETAPTPPKQNRQQPIKPLSARSEECWVCAVQLKLKSDQFWYPHPLVPNQSEGVDDGPTDTGSTRVAVEVNVCFVCLQKLKAQDNVALASFNDKCNAAESVDVCGLCLKTENDEGLNLFSCNSCSRYVCDTCVATCHGGGAPVIENMKRLKDLDQTWFCPICDAPLAAMFDKADFCKKSSNRTVEIACCELKVVVVEQESIEKDLRHKEEKFKEIKNELHEKGNCQESALEKFRLWEEKLVKHNEQLLDAQDHLHDEIQRYGKDLGEVYREFGLGTSWREELDIIVEVFGKGKLRNMEWKLKADEEIVDQNCTKDSTGKEKSMEVARVCKPDPPGAVASEEAQYDKVKEKKKQAGLQQLQPKQNPVGDSQKLVFQQGLSCQQPSSLSTKPTPTPTMVTPLQHSI